ncbi:MAG TPA: hypothetical protein DIT48_00580 [Actinobacteria bacterium]|nr:hypothetical protein [Actinomycetota bacterium]
MSAPERTLTMTTEMTRDSQITRRVTISLEPHRWHGQSVLSLGCAIEAWLIVAIMVAVILMSR